MDFHLSHSYNEIDGTIPLVEKSRQGPEYLKPEIPTWWKYEATKPKITNVFCFSSGSSIELC